MVGWVCLKALPEIPFIKKAFVLSTWDIYRDFKNVKDTIELERNAREIAGEYFVLNTPVRDIFEPVIFNPEYYNLTNITKDVSVISSKKIFMLDEHGKNEALASAFMGTGTFSYLNYEVWNTDHSFTNKRVALIKKAIEFLDK